MPQYKLTYFPIRGRAEITRLIFAQAGVQYEDNRVDREQWPSLKPGTPWGQMPVLEVDGKVIGQSITIARYVAREHGLAGKDNKEQALADSVVDALVDLQNCMTKAYFEPDETRKAELFKKLEEEDVPKTFDNLQKFLGSDQYFVGNQVTWADLFFLNIAENLINRQGDLFKNYAKLGELYNRVANLPNIKKWLETRPKTEI